MAARCARRNQAGNNGSRVGSIFSEIAFRPKKARSKLLNDAFYAIFVRSDPAFPVTCSDSGGFPPG